MTPTTTIAATLLAAALGFTGTAFAAASLDRESATEQTDAGKTNNRAWPMTISMGYGSDRRCMINENACDTDAISEEDVTRTRARPTTTSMGYGSDLRCLVNVVCGDDALSEGSVTKARARPTVI